MTFAKKISDDQLLDLFNGQLDPADAEKIRTELEADAELKEQYARVIRRRLADVRFARKLVNASLMHLQVPPDTNELLSQGEAATAKLKGKVDGRDVVADVAIRRSEDGRVVLDLSDAPEGLRPLAITATSFTQSNEVTPTVELRQSSDGFTVTVVEGGVRRNADETQSSQRYSADLAISASEKPKSGESNQSMKFFGPYVSKNSDGLDAFFITRQKDWTMHVASEQKQAMDEFRIATKERLSRDKKQQGLKEDLVQLTEEFTKKNDLRDFVSVFKGLDQPVQRGEVRFELDDQYGEVVRFSLRSVQPADFDLLDEEQLQNVREAAAADHGEHAAVLMASEEPQVFALSRSLFEFKENCFVHVSWRDRGKRLHVDATDVFITDHLEDEAVGTDVDDDLNVQSQREQLKNAIEQSVWEKLVLLEPKARRAARIRGAGKDALQDALVATLRNPHRVLDKTEEEQLKFLLGRYSQCRRDRTKKENNLPGNVSDTVRCGLADLASALANKEIQTTEAVEVLEAISENARKLPAGNDREWVMLEIEDIRNEVDRGYSHHAADRLQYLYEDLSKISWHRTVYGDVDRLPEHDKRLSGTAARLDLEQAREPFSDDQNALLDDRFGGSMTYEEIGNKRGRHKSSAKRQLDQLEAELRDRMSPSEKTSD